jgi:diadenosine tetraphosphate (Ap4A) HIT family hydrolase
VNTPAWADAGRWTALADGSECPICRRGGPRDVVAELATTWVSAPPRAALPGYVCVVSKRHVVEPFELPSDEQAAFWEEAMAVARGLAALLQPVKMNYEIHGNVIPHLHLHLYPRYPGDAFGTGALRSHDEPFVRSNDELRRIAEAVRATEPT